MNKKENQDYLEVLRSVHKNPNASQRDLASELGISLGKLNYLVKAMANQGLIKINNFSNSKKKFDYIYLLTSEGLRHKIRLTRRFMDIKLKEYDQLKKEIEISDSNKKN
tara:strand:- start:22443 stop:22769 length:327 start_codon:yes stop_codon:yes gene_type:complete